MNGYYVLKMLERVVKGCMNGEFDVIVTGFVYKGVINCVGVVFSGYIEFFVE